EAPSSQRRADAHLRRGRSRRIDQRPATLEGPVGRAALSQPKRLAGRRALALSGRGTELRRRPPCVAARRKGISHADPPLRKRRRLGGKRRTKWHLVPACRRREDPKELSILFRDSGPIFPIAGGPACGRGDRGFQEEQRSHAFFPGEPYQSPGAIYPWTLRGT